MEFPSKLIQDAVDELSRLPGIGKKTALRLALHILRQNESDAEQLGGAIISLRRNARYCVECGNLSDGEVCGICSDTRRDKTLVCVVEDCKDVIAIENTHQFPGVYHVLGGLINPLAGIGPSQLNIDALVEKVRRGGVKELLFAFSANLEGDTTTYYVTRKLREHEVKVTSIARGIPMGTELEFTDELTLARSILNRTQLPLTSEANGN